MPSKYSFFQTMRRMAASLQGKELPDSREGQLRAVAHRLGMTYRPVDEFNARNLLTEFQLFKRGRNRSIRNILEKQTEDLDTKVQIFDYRFETGYKKTRRSWDQTVFFVESKKLAVPEFSMQPETVFNKLGTYLFKMQDIDFDKYPKYSDNYLLRGEDEHYIRFMMNDRLLQLFNSETGWYMEGINFYLILYKLNTRFKARSIRDFYQQGESIYQLIAKEMQWDPILFNR